MFDLITEKISLKTLIYLIFTPLLVFVSVTLLPKTIGCVLPDYMCMSGSEKLSDVLSISAALIPIILVAEAYKMWRKQKSAELLAIDARGIYTQLKQLLEKIKKIKLRIENNPSTTSTKSDDYLEFVELYKKLNDDLDLFKLLLWEENSTHLMKFNDFYSYFSKYLGILQKIDIYRINTSENKIMHSKNMIEKIEIDKFIADVEHSFNLFAKIILHKQ